MRIKSILINYSLFTIPFFASAAVPQRWVVETSQVKPVVFEAIHGETLALEATFKSYGTDVSTSNMTAFLCWQTNGMANAWWVTNAVTSGHSASVLFTPSMDPGVPVVNAYIGMSESTNNQLPSTLYHLPSISYRAAFTIRFRHGPGAVPNAIAAPVPILDLANTTVINPPWPTEADLAATTTVMKAELKVYVDDQIEGSGLVTPQFVTNTANKLIYETALTKTGTWNVGSVSSNRIDTLVQLRDDAPHSLILGRDEVYIAQGFTPTENIEFQGYDTELGLLRRHVVGTYTNESFSPFLTAENAYRKSDIESTSVTNRGASAYADAVGATTLASAKSYADASFVKGFMPSGNNYYLVTNNIFFGEDISNTGAAINGRKFQARSYRVGSSYVPPRYMFDTGTAQSSISADTECFSFARHKPRSSTEVYKSSRLDPDNSPVVTSNMMERMCFLKAETDPSVPSWAKAANPPASMPDNGLVLTNDAVKTKSGTSITASNVGAADSATVSQLGASVAAIGAHLNAEDARFVSTNYDSVANIPEAYCEIKINNNWQTIWKEMTRWGKFVGNAFNWSTWHGFHAWSTNVTAQLATKAERCWGIYDSETGEYSPDGFTQISSSNILIAANMSYKRVVDTANAIWVLECNQGTATFGGETNGYFRVKDGDGNTQFEIINGNQRELGADAGGITVARSGGNNVMTILYSVVANNHPTLKICTDLVASDWVAEGSSGCAGTVVWSGGSGAYVATVTVPASTSSAFVKATYLGGSETIINNVAPTKMQYIYIGNTKYAIGYTTIGGQGVMTLTPQ